MLQHERYDPWMQKYSALVRVRVVTPVAMK
jgi:hypothetical protein